MEEAAGGGGTQDPPDPVPIRIGYARTLREGTARRDRRDLEELPALPYRSARSHQDRRGRGRKPQCLQRARGGGRAVSARDVQDRSEPGARRGLRFGSILKDRKSTRLNSSHMSI